MERVHDKRVAYIYHDKIGTFSYGRNHLMKPKRIKMAHDLIEGYGLYRQMNGFKPKLATYTEIMKFHSSLYTAFLKNINLFKALNLHHAKYFSELAEMYNVGTKDCPLFKGLVKYSQIVAGGTLMAASILNSQTNDICI